MRSLGTAAAIVMGIVLLFTFPVSWNATSFGIVQPEQRQPILSIVAGRLASCVEAGQYVRKGEVIATLENPTLELERSNLQVQLQQARTRQESLRRKRAFDQSASQSLLMQSSKSWDWSKNSHCSTKILNSSPFARTERGGASSLIEVP